MQPLLIKQNKEFMVLIILAAIFFFIYSFLPISQLTQSRVPMDKVTMRFNTPDEVMNYHFTKLYAEQGKMYYFEPLNLIADNVIFPRWAKPVADKITPGTFQGIILIYGTLAKALGSGVIPFLTPFFAVIGVLFFYLLIKLFFDKRIAFVSALLMFIFPGFWYYVSRTMFHNVLFLSLLIIGFYFLLSSLSAFAQSNPNATADRLKSLNFKKAKQWYLLASFILSGLFIGLALITRTSEIVWVGLTFLLIVLFYKKQIIQNKTLLLYYFITSLLIILCFVPIFYNNKILYGSYFSTGYSSVVSENLEDILEAKKIGLTQAIFLPFGFHPRVIITHALNKYFVQLFWPWIIWFLAGLILFFKQKNKPKKQVLYFYFLLLASSFLLLYYGSWFFQDSLNPNLVSLGSSYVRYFLPVYIFSLPFIALALVGFYQIIKIKNKLLAIATSALVSCFLFLVSFLSVYYKGPESLTKINNNLLTYRIQAQSILEKTKPDDVILTDISQDKILFPERQHLIVPQDGSELEKVKFLLNFTDVYFFYRSADVDANYLNEIKFKPYGLEIYDEVEIEGGGILFRVREWEEYYAVIGDTRNKIQISSNNQIPNWDWIK